MEKGEISWFKVCPKYHYYEFEEKKLVGIFNEEKVDLKEDEWLYFKINLIEFDNSIIYNGITLSIDNFEERLQYCFEFKTIGNEFIHEGNYSSGIKFYRKGKLNNT